MLRVVIADDAPFFREMVSLVLRTAGIEVVAEAGDVPELHAAVERHSPDLVIVDVRMPPGGTTDGLSAAARLRAQRPQMGILVISQYVETRHLAAILDGGRARAVGYLLKERVAGVEQFVSEIHRVAEGQIVVDPQVVSMMLADRRSRLEHLSDRETQVLALMAEGHSNLAISQTLNLAERTVLSHIRNIFVRLDLHPAPGYHRRVQAVLEYLQSPKPPREPDEGIS
jgi:DNA-binding NarL/FixJ family response regulator